MWTYLSAEYIASRANGVYEAVMPSGKVRRGFLRAVCPGSSAKLLLMLATPTPASLEAVCATLYATSCKLYPANRGQQSCTKIANDGY